MAGQTEPIKIIWTSGTWFDTFACPVHRVIHTAAQCTVTVGRPSATDALVITHMTLVLTNTTLGKVGTASTSWHTCLCTINHYCVFLAANTVLICRTWTPIALLMAQLTEIRLVSHTRWEALCNRTVLWFQYKGSLTGWTAECIKWGTCETVWVTRLTDSAVGDKASKSGNECCIGAGKVTSWTIITC